MDIPEDEDCGWYICQCIAGTENSVKAQLEQVVPKTPGAMEDIAQFCVPCRLAGDSRMDKVSIYRSYH